MDETMLGLINALAPDLMEELSQRAMVLERISILQPVGRRALAQRMSIPERESRRITDLLREDGLIEVSPAGMKLSEKAYELLDSVRELVRSRSGLNSLETQLQRLLRIERVRVVPGDADSDADVLGEVGRAAGVRLRNPLKPRMRMKKTTKTKRTKKKP
jgi:central glycolytic genes regulator